MLRVVAVVVLVAATRPQSAGFLLGAKLLNGEHVGMSQKVVGSNPGPGKGIFLMMSQVKCTCTILSSWTLNFIQL